MPTTVTKSGLTVMEPGAPPEPTPTPAPPAPSTPSSNGNGDAPAPAPQPVTAPKVIRGTSGDRYVVRTPTPEGYRQELLTKEEIEARGGSIPKPIQERQRIQRVTEERGAVAGEQEKKKIVREKEIKAFAEKHAMSFKAAEETLARFKKDPGAAEFAPLKTVQVRSLAKAAKVSRKAISKAFRANHTLLKDGTWVSNRDLKQVKKDDPDLYSVLRQKGFEQYAKVAGIKLVTAKRERVALTKQYQAKLREFESELKEQPKVLKDAYAAGGIDAYNKAVKIYNTEVEKEIKDFHAKNIVFGNEGMLVEDWNRLDPKYQQMVKDNKGFAKMQRVMRADYVKFRETHTEVGDGQWMNDEVLADIKKNTPKLYTALKREGYDKTYGKLDKLKEDNPREYLGELKKYDIVPQGAIYIGQLPDGSVQYTPSPKDMFIDPIFGPTERELTGAEKAKAVGTVAAEMFVPGVWAKDAKNMPAWQVGLNTGLDLLIIVPLAGWGARLGGKAILKAGTSTISKALVKELPATLVKAGETQLARESIAIGKNVKRLDRLLAEVEKAAKATVKAEKANDVNKFAQAVKVETLAKADYTRAIRKMGTDIAVLNSKLQDVKGIKTLNVEGLSKAVGMADRAEDFSNFAAGIQKEITRNNIKISRSQKTLNFLKNQVRGYIETPRTIAEVSKASAIAATKGPKAAAAYLRGEAKLAKVVEGGKTATDAFIKGGEKEVHQYLTSIEKSLAKESKATMRRLAKYEGKAKTLAKWDAYIQENWPPSGGKWYPRIGLPTEGGSSTVSTLIDSPAQAKRAGIGALPSTYQLPLYTMAGTRFATVIVDPDKGTTEIVRNPAEVELPHIVVVEDDKWPIVAPSGITETEPEVTPTVRPEPSPERQPSIKVYYIEKPKTQRVTEVKTAAEVSPATKAAMKAASRVKTGVKTGVMPKTELKASLKPAAKLAPAAKAAAAMAPAVAPKVAPGIATKVAAKIKPAIKPAIVPKIKTATTTTTVTTAKPPPIIPIIRGGKVDEKALQRLVDKKGAVTWRQGFVWHTMPPPYNAIYSTRKPPKGAQVVNSRKSAYETIQTIKGKPPTKDVDVDVGITDAKLRRPQRPGTKGTIMFRGDPRQQTTGHLTVKKGWGQGGRVPGLLSRRPVRSRKGMLSRRF